jgi:formate hydrogenlyase transcriptional activator
MKRSPMRPRRSPKVADLERLIGERTSELHRAEERQRLLLELNNAVISNLTRDALFHAIAQALRRVVPFDRTAIFLHDPARDVLRLFVLESAFTSSYFTVGLEMASAESHVGWVFQNRRWLCRRDLEKERQYPMEDRALADGVRSYIIVPLVALGTAVGVLAVASTRRNQYSDTDAELLQEAANQVALAVENMKAYEAITTLNHEMRQEMALRREAEEELRAALAEVEKLRNRLQAENVYLQEEIRREHNFVEMVGASPALLRVLRQVEQVAPTDSTVLISGETGTGKELIARAIHNRSARRERPLVKVNCSAISAGLVESELFGHVKGAFTGALERRVGRFELADGGTVFLDEVGDLPLETQVKLLRVLQEREFEPVGSNRTLQVDVRVIAATNRDLAEAIRAGRFRADLYYRLNVVPVYVPPLRERQSDIPQLVMFFLDRYAKRFGKAGTRVSEATLERLHGYSWPGNVRELQNVIERAVVLSLGPVLELDHDLVPVTGAPHAAPAGSAPPPASATLEAIERAHIVGVLDRTGWVVEGPRGAAKVLALHPNTLRSRMERLGIKRPRHESS